MARPATRRPAAGGETHHRLRASRELRRGLRALGLLAVLAALGRGAAAQAPAAAPWTSVEREIQVRTWAVDPPAHRAELAAAAGAGEGDWTRRAAALEALRRAALVGALDGRSALVVELEPHLRRALEGADDRVLAQALDLAAVWPVELGLTRAELAPAAAHPHPSVRLALVRCVERYPAAGALLVELVRDPDERVALEARRTWVASPALRAAVVDDAGEVRDAGFARGGSQGTGLARGLSAAALERANAPAEYLSDLSPLGLALELRLHGTPAAAHALAAVWERVETPGERDLLLRAARASRARGLPLDAALFARLGEVRGEDARRWLLEGLVTAADPGRLVAELDPETATEVLGLLIGREVDWDLERMRPFVDPETAGRDLRLRALMTLAVAPTRGPDDPAEQLLALGLEDPDPALVEVCFRALTASPDPWPWMEALHGAWLRLDEGGRARFLRYLPRERAPTPFRGDLLDLAGDPARPPAVRASALELLATFRGDAALAATVDGWLVLELESLLAAPAAPSTGEPEGELGGEPGGRLDGGARRLSELRCTGLVRALDRLRGAAAVPRLLQTLELVAPPGAGFDDVGKVTAATLGATAEGRVALERWLAAEGASRVRIEAAIQLVSRGAPPALPAAIEVLVAAYPGCDWELRTRILKSLQRKGDELSFVFQERVAADPDEEWELRHLALAGLAQRGRGEAVTAVLRRVYEATGDPEVRRSVVGLFGGLGGAEARAFLQARLEEIEALALETRDDAVTERARSEREALIVALGQASLDSGAMPPELLRAWLRLPRAARARDLEARFVGKKLATTTFRYGAELSLGELLAAVGSAPAALADGGAWWALDARFLAALGDRLASGGDLASAQALWRAALVGLAGEGEAPDRAALELHLRRRLMAAAESGGDWDELAGLCALVLRDWRLFRTPAHAFQTQFGDFQPARGRDPERRLESALHQARAQAALARGDLGSARAHAAAASGGLGFSTAAREAQERLERALGEAERRR